MFTGTAVRDGVRSPIATPAGALAITSKRSESSHFGAFAIISSPLISQAPPNSVWSTTRRFWKYWPAPGIESIPSANVAIVVFLQVYAITGRLIGPCGGPPPAGGGVVFSTVKLHPEPEPSASFING